MSYPKPDAYPKETSGIVKTYYYWQMGSLYIGGVKIGPSNDAWFNSILAALLKKRPRDGLVKTEIILT